MIKVEKYIRKSVVEISSRKHIKITLEEASSLTVSG
jgi:hypothetical protein